MIVYLLGTLAIYLISFLGTLAILTVAAFVTDHVHQEDPDEDLQWIEQQIERAENVEPVSEDADVQRREYLGRLRRIRRELLREGR